MATYDHIVSNIGTENTTLEPTPSAALTIGVLVAAIARLVTDIILFAAVWALWGWAACIAVFLVQWGCNTIAAAFRAATCDRTQP